MNLFIGLISGTSMDGIDAALIDSNSHKLITGITTPYTQSLKKQLLTFDPNQKHTPQALLELNHLLGHAFSNAALALLKKTKYNPKDITAIGSHGQTLYHSPDTKIRTTLQLGCPHTIAVNTGITVVADFRTRDLVLGGQGAPLAPYYHQELLKKQNLPLAIVNIGGVSNLSILNKSAAPVGYDTGPGNVLMDTWIRQHKNLAYDINGDWAATGRVIPKLLDRLLTDTYFSKPAPKSLDKAYYSLNWLKKHLLQENQKPEDVQATLLHFTARTIADAVRLEVPDCKQLLLCGGGAHNQALIQALTAYLTDCEIKTTDAFDINPDYLEAMMFAWFAEQTLKKQALDLTQITGASKPAILGAIYL